MTSPQARDSLILTLVATSLIAAVIVDLYLLGPIYLISGLYALPVLIAAYHWPARRVTAIAGLVTVANLATTYLQRPPPEVWPVYSVSLALLAGLAILLAFQRQQAMARARETALKERQLPAIIDGAPAVISIKDTQGRFTTVNRKFEAIFHVDRQQIVDQTDYDVFPREIADAVRANDREVIEHGSAIQREEVIPQDDGLHTYLSIKFPLLDANGQPDAVCSISTDITERTRAEEQRDRSLAAEQAARAEAEAAVATVQRLQLVTEAALAHLSLDDLLGELLQRIRAILQVDTAAILLLEPSGETLAVRAAVGLEEAVERAIRIPIGRGFAGRVAAERRPIAIDDIDQTEILNPVLHEKGLRSLLGAPLLIEGRVIGVLHVGTLRPRRFTDDDERLLQLVADRVAIGIDRARLLGQASEADALRRAERLQSALLSSVSHDLRTPLAAIKASVGNLLDETVNWDSWDSAQRRELLLAIDEEADRLTRFIARLLELSRLEGGAVQPQCDWHDLEEIVAGVLERLDPRGDRSRLEVLSRLPLAYLDYLMVEQIVANLVENALKFSPPDAPVEVTLRSSQGQLTVEVADRGPGIPPAERERVFRKFYRASSGANETSGTGIGLAIARGLTQALGGQLRYAPRPGGGSLFCLALAIDARRATQAAP